ncbi:hypothetical protein L9W73_15220 [Vibrio aestuarianus]|uniref:Uncharacterized protein n=1 Tax=Vibrio aestuarianus TaxID=28171 RepID=A0A9X4FIY2_9VIBR|nr:hypothetical protein [Vibrio aestuarianus]MDE1237838.1 hypothetical protein [Vibrio aestuarianus]MDE1316462.1 hypothetical protein [Vibrio aestuarianus]MDE1358643.1 hypothetical protein [Vibrio aestuarianus]
MIFHAVSTAVAFLVVGIIISPNTPRWLDWVAYSYLLVMLLVGVLAINAERISKYLEKKLDENARNKDL